MHPYAKEGEEWARLLATCTDEELVARHNGSVGLRCFGYARQMYLWRLKAEVLSRDFDSSVVIERDGSGEVTSYKLTTRVEIAVARGGRYLRPTTSGETSHKH